MDLSAASLKIMYYAGSAATVGFLAWNGWRQGAARQAMTLVSILCAYATAWFGATSAAPLFRFLGYPRQITILLAGSALGCATFLGLHGLRRIFFKRTAQQKNPRARLGYGIVGACIGLAFGTALFLITSGTIRALGAVAKSRLDDLERETHASEHGKKAPPVSAADEPGALARGMAKLGGALDEGASGAFFHHYDEKIPAAHVFATITKVGIMVSRPEAIDRFLSYPGVEKLATHPKLVAVKNDPVVSELLTSGSYVKLLRHEKVLALASDGEFNTLMKEMQFEKALDHALKPEHPAATPPAVPEKVP